MHLTAALPSFLASYHSTVSINCLLLSFLRYASLNCHLPAALRRGGTGGRALRGGGRTDGICTGAPRAPAANSISLPTCQLITPLAKPVWRRRAGQITPRGSPELYPVLPDYFSMRRHDATKQRSSARHGGRRLSRLNPQNQNAAQHAYARHAGLAAGFSRSALQPRAPRDASTLALAATAITWR